MTWSVRRHNLFSMFTANCWHTFFYLPLGWWWCRPWAGPPMFEEGMNLKPLEQAYLRMSICLVLSVFCFSCSGDFVDVRIYVGWRQTKLMQLQGCAMIFILCFSAQRFVACLFCASTALATLLSPARLLVANLICVWQCWYPELLVNLVSWWRNTAWWA